MSDRKYSELPSADFISLLYQQLPDKDPNGHSPKVLIVGPGSDKTVVGSIYCYISILN